MSKNKIIAAILGVIFLVGGLAVGLYLVGQRQILTKKAAPASSIYITPVTQTKAPGDAFTFSVSVDTGSNQLNGFDVIINFDPSAIEIVSIQKGSAISNFGNQIYQNGEFNNNTGTITYGYFTSASAQAVSGSGIELFQVSAKVKAAATEGSYSLAFDPKTKASDINEDPNILVSKTNGALTVAGTSASATASPTASPTSSSHSTATATATSTASPTATATVSGGVGGAGNNNSGSGTARTASPRPAATQVALPDTGTAWPTIGAAGLGVLVIIGSLLLAL